MDAAALVFLVPYVVSLLISCLVAAYAWRRRADPGAAAYAFVAMSQASWTFGSILEMISPEMSGKAFWDSFQFISGGGWMLGIVAFTLQYTGRHLSRPRLFYALLSFPAVAIPILAFTDSLHGLIRINPMLVIGRPFSALIYGYTPADWFWSFYGYIVFLTCFGLLFAHFVRSHRLYRAQVAIVLIGNLIPLLGTVLTATVMVSMPFRDMSPITFAVGNVVVAWGMFRFRLLDVLPVARDAIVENLRDAVFVFDAQQRLVDLNQAARALIGRPDPDVIGQLPAQIFAAWPHVLNQRYADRGVDEVEVEFDTPTGHHQVELRIQPLTNWRNRPLGYLALSRDITDRKMAQEALKKRTAELEESNTRLEQMSRVKDEFVSNVSHELRTPLTSMKLNINLLTLRPDRRDAYLAVLQREVERLEGMIEGLLTLSRFDQDRVDIHSQSVDLNSLAEQYVLDRAALAESKGLTLAIDSAQELPCLNVDRTLIGQALSILLTNAINYTPSGGHVTVRTELDGSGDQEWAGLSVSDTGPGIPPEEQARLFSRFFRGSAGRKSSISGTGLGLALAKEIVERFHGRIEVVSEGKPGKGAIFSLWLPADGGSGEGSREDLGK